MSKWSEWRQERRKRKQHDKGMGPKSYMDPNPNAYAVANKMGSTPINSRIQCEACAVGGVNAAAVGLWFVQGGDQILPDQEIQALCVEHEEVWSNGGNSYRLVDLTE